MQDHVGRVAKKAGVAVPSILEAARLSRSRLAIARKQLETFRTGGIDVVAFGSMARLETTPESDFDYLVLATRLPVEADAPDRLLREADKLRTLWAVEEGRVNPEVSPPGASGLFGTVIGAFELVDRIGLQQDTNHSLTRRMLLLEESVSLLDAGVHTEVVRAALDRYMTLAGARENKVPRFLLNDVVRYWRTITVDYQAKARAGENPSGLRYIKLIIARKVLYAGTLMSLLMCGKENGHKANADDLLKEFSKPPLARLVGPYDYAPARVQEAMAGVLLVVDTYLKLSGQALWRETVKVASKSDDVQVKEFADMCDQARILQAHLETIFFEWEILLADSRSLLAF